MELADEKHRDKERKEDVRNLAIVCMVEQEAALYTEEKRQFGNLLKKEYFTKSG